MAEMRRGAGRWSLARLAAMLTALLLGGCSALDVVNAVAPTGDAAVASGLAYGAHPRQRLDLYRPAAASEQAAVIIFFYGGAWEGGERADYAFLAQRLAAAGHFVVVPDYRVYPEVRFPLFVEDGARATAWIMERMNVLFDRPRPLFLMGHSAGAHIAMLLGVDARYLQHYGRDNRQLAGIIGLAGPYDFLPLESERLRQIFATEAQRRDSQPVNFVDASDPPVLLAHGDRDKRVWLRNSLNMARQLRQAGGDVTLRVYPGVGHAGLIKPFIGLVRDDSGLVEEILTFIAARSAQ
jgi:acetyl esterase/lipase